MIYFMDRDNDTWLTHLMGTGSVQETALSDLRNTLLKSLRKVMTRKSFSDDAFLEDVVQDSLLLILQKLHQFQGRSKFLTWATSISIHLAMSKLRKHQWKDVSLEEITTAKGKQELESMDENPGVDRELERKAIVKEMYSVIQNELTEKQKTALLAELKGMPMEEIARHLGINRNAVYKLTHDARKKLKWGLEAAGYMSADVSEAFTI